MSDSSEEEDLSRFREVVDTSFTKLINESRGLPAIQATHENSQEKPNKSERYLDESCHYNDVKVPEELQRRIGSKLSAIIQKNIEFVDMATKTKKRKIRGGVKLFKASDGYLSCEEAKDTFTEKHNMNAKKLKKQKQHIAAEDQSCSEDDVDIDPETLIALVQQRPVLWNKTIEETNKQRVKFFVWKEVFKKFKPDFEDLGDQEQKEFGKLVMSKWKNMKDRWIRLHKIDSNVSGSTLKKRSKYIYYEQMLFLKKITEHKPEATNQAESNDSSSQIDDYTGNDSVETVVNSSRRSKPPKLKNGEYTEHENVATQKRRKRPNDETEKQTEVEIEFMNRDPLERCESSRSMNFFRGIAPAVDKLNTDNMIEFQFKVLSVIKTLTQKEIAQKKCDCQWNHDQYQTYNTDIPTPSMQLQRYSSTDQSASVFKSSRPVSSFVDGQPSISGVTHDPDESDIQTHTYDPLVANNFDLEEKYDVKDSLQ